jgi:G:T-mismatch repair DNA endonuclease (very short patch repair protein)
MPRYINRRIRLTTEERSIRSLTQRAPRNQGFFDPFPWVHGTLPEKMVYAELSRRGIKFLFLNDLTFTIPEIDFNKQYQADFVLPDHKLIIEVQGAYWHSMEKTIEADAFKFAVYEMTGWKVLAWWDYEIIARLQELIAAEPILAGYAPATIGAGSSELPVKSRKKQDTSKGIRTLNQKRGQRNAYKREAATIKTKKTAGRKNAKTIFG